jgi:hypothetical protein
MKHIDLTQVLGFVLLFPLAAHAGLLAQPRTAPTPGDVRFRGVVVDGEGAKVSGAVVTVEDGSLKRELRSNGAGEFEDRLPAGMYRITIEKPGYKKHVWEAFRIGAGAETPYEFKVQAAQAPDVHDIEPGRTSSLL